VSFVTPPQIIDLSPLAFFSPLLVMGSHGGCGAAVRFASTGGVSLRRAFVEHIQKQKKKHP